MGHHRDKKENRLSSSFDRVSGTFGESEDVFQPSQSQDWLNYRCFIPFSSVCYCSFKLPI